LGRGIDQDAELLLTFMDLPGLLDNRCFQCFIQFLQFFFGSQAIDEVSGLLA
jgi:hypothetical protein